jgi:hypothetical protein
LQLPTRIRTCELCDVRNRNFGFYSFSLVLTETKVTALLHVATCEKEDFVVICLRLCVYVVIDDSLDSTWKRLCCLHFVGVFLLFTSRLHSFCTVKSFCVSCGLGVNNKVLLYRTKFRIEIGKLSLVAALQWLPDVRQLGKSLPIRLIRGSVGNPCYKLTVLLPVTTVPATSGTVYRSK